MTLAIVPSAPAGTSAGARSAYAVVSVSHDTPTTIATRRIRRSPEAVRSATAAVGTTSKPVMRVSNDAPAHRPTTTHARTVGDVRAWTTASAVLRTVSVNARSIPTTWPNPIVSGFRNQS